ncbi:nicotinate-nucleotide--dimethylbenzimidazole phosphoribosyltransferase [Sphingomonas koreensis]|uniref:nicotinate-nucleotide--dimethylbenzimidazole phosphoribosyltransferase n=1 Tax=Sphingomonas koreensis TaxID=93064 RepID=UPI00083773A0|nr:nicotinate-nucleotide--dimethylbenzimidazole phosphoribosyltransferase [Sphingomonas koreensis]PJI87390.1 nicotinate-nucleotide-dimethylbenzimidazole phosphoribosyltransferase [Sphingomonas koreensis]RSU62789.1 nicotinate-nucleotide--dimethylbenzimidazole phosphoribosyltransferase [Sphingomonas koreensis]RSU71498.1 nicotinate-nucleotide--dimethylbenzimidazole phosphoribosyltransferase [Sphingomonas koreensis]
MRFDSPQAFAARLADLPGPDAGAREAAAARQAQLTKPAGSLGRLEEIALFMAGWQGKERPALDRVRTAIFAGNHGVTRHGISAFPADVTVQMVANFEAGGAAINQLARAAGLELRVIALDLDRPTADFTEAPAMSADECLDALNRGAELVEPGLDLLTVGEMGIGNSTAAAALCARSLGGDVRDWVGPGTGLDPAGIVRKVAVTEQALAKHADAPRIAFETLRRLGGREIAAIAGAVLAARHARVPVMLDGFIACAALAPLVADQPALAEHCLAGHCSAEPGHRRLLHQFSLTPLLQLGMRLGEGSGAAVAVPIVRSALATHNGMATFAEASVSGKL